MNIILIISDTFRYDNLLGRAVMPVRTPHLDAFHERAVSCTRMYQASFPTIPHRTDLTSGRYGWPWYPWQPLERSTRNHLPRLLASRGFATQLICDCPHLFSSGFQHGFHAAVQTRGQEGDIPLLRTNHPIEQVVPYAKTRHSKHFRGALLADIHCWTNREWSLGEHEERRFAPSTARKAIEFLEDNYRGGPFFLWIDFFDPHEPWDPPEYMVRKYQREYDGIPMLHPNYGRASDYTPHELTNLRAHYCAESEMVDRWVGRVLEKIDDLALWEESVVVFTADHGTLLGEHDRTGKSNINEGDDRYWPIYPQIARVPFLIAAPGLEGGREVDALLQPPDILPTILDLAGVPLEAPDPVHGLSFAELLVGNTRDHPNECAITAECPRAGALGSCDTTPFVYTERWAYAPVGSSGSAELYDLDTDPECETNVVDDHPAAAADLLAKAERLLARIDAPERARRLVLEGR